MKKALRKFFAGILTAAMVIGSLTITAAAEGEEYTLFIAYGGDAEADGDWGYGYAGPTSDNSDNIEAVVETIKVGETKTVSLTLANECLNTWYLAPVLLAENVTDLDVDIHLAIDGNEVVPDLAQGDLWWYEGTGNYSGEEAIRLAGGYNEWGTQYMEKPIFTTIEFTITLNDIQTGSAAEVELAPYEGEFDAYLAFACNDDWGVYYYNPGNEAGVTQEPQTVKVGDTFTLSATLDEECGYTWFLAPVLVASDIAELEYDITCLIDGQEVEMDLTAGDAWWYEGTGDFDETQAIRLAGGYNEWGAQFIPSPVFTTIEYTITINSAMAGTVVDAAAEEVEAIPFDADGTYNAYIGFQSPKYSFRNAWNDATYGKETDFFNQVTGWDAENNAMVVPGSFNDVVIAGNGTYTVSATDIEFPDGEFDAQDYMNLIFVSTDIPRDAVEISDVVLKVNGSTVDLAAAGALISPEDNDQYVTIMLQNIWNSDVTTIGYYSTPVKSLEVSFTVNGFNYDAAVAEEPAEETPAETPAAEVTEAPAQTEANDSTLPGWVLPVCIGGGVVVVGGGVGAGVAMSKKKKK